MRGSEELFALSSSRRWYRELVLHPNNAKLRKNYFLYNEKFHPVFLSKSRLKTLLHFEYIANRVYAILLDGVLRWTKNYTLKKQFQSKRLQNLRKFFKSSDFFRTALQLREGEPLSIECGLKREVHATKPKNKRRWTIKTVACLLRPLVSAAWTKILEQSVGANQLVVYCVSTGRVFAKQSPPPEHASFNSLFVRTASQLCRECDSENILTSLI